MGGYRTASHCRCATVWRFSGQHQMLPFDRLTAPSSVDGWFENLTTLSPVDGPLHG